MQPTPPKIIKHNPRIVKTAGENLLVDIYALHKNRLQKYISVVPAAERVIESQSIVYSIIYFYWKGRFKDEKEFNLPKYSYKKQIKKVNVEIIDSCKILGKYAATLEVIEASYLIGNLYTATIPDEIRSTNGVYYTPPNLTSRLLNLVEKTGINWSTAKILDPACGGGAFLAPVALRMVSVLNQDSNSVITHVENHLKGFEIDSFSAWLSQVFVEVAVSKHCLIAKRRLKNIIEVRNSLAIEDAPEKFDLIIGNPPYGRIKLEKGIRKKFENCLYGHANLYGLFVHVAFQLIQRKGVIAFVTPTGFLGGEYFKKLRSFICGHGTPIEFDFISFRKGIFEDVLQETMLAIYREGKSISHPVLVNEIIPSSTKQYDIHQVGSFPLPEDTSAPWLLSRNKANAKLVTALAKLHHHLQDWGYEVKTGPLVWNRHKPQLRTKKGDNTFPLIWAETISTKGEFRWKAEKKNHTLYFKFKTGDEWLLEKKPCIIMQRTTAKEQEKRLLTSILPKKMFRESGAVIIENHLNVIQPISSSPKVSLELLNFFFSTKIADDVFRCISGSVAVSAYEIESMPLPDPELLPPIQRLLDARSESKIIEEAFISLYS